MGYGPQPRGPGGGRSHDGALQRRLGEARIVKEVGGDVLAVNGGASVLHGKRYEGDLGGTPWEQKESRGKEISSPQRMVYLINTPTLLSCSGWGSFFYSSNSPPPSINISAANPSTNKTLHPLLHTFGGGYHWPADRPLRVAPPGKGWG